MSERICRQFMPRRTRGVAPVVRGALRLVALVVVVVAIGATAVLPARAQELGPRPVPDIKVTDVQTMDDTKVADTELADAQSATLDWRDSRPDDAVVADLATTAKETGSVRVIAGLPIEWTPEGYLSAPDIERQRSTIQQAQNAVIELTGPKALLRRYDSLPYTVLNLDADAVFGLARSRLVASLARDGVNVPFLHDSTRLIGAQSANLRGYDGASRAVAILDTGVDTSHPFLGGRVVDESCFGVCPDGTATMTGPGAATPCSVADCEHGTHVAGIAAGAGGHVGFTNFDGVAPRAEIVAVQVFQKVSNSPSDPVGSPACGTAPSPCPIAFDSDIIAGLQHVLALVQRGFRVDAANLSLGGTSIMTTACDTSPYKPAIDSLRSLGVATVIAAGNEGSTTGVSSPACVSTAIAVGASTKADTVASFSNASALVDLFAPGQDITSSVPGGYTAMDGTSMAAPHVAGAWALLRERRPNMPVALGLKVLALGPFIAGPGSFTGPRINVDDALRRLRDPHDYDGDGRTDLALFRSSAGAWLFDSPPRWQGWGQPGDIPVPADYDGNGSTDVAVFRPSTSTWFVLGLPSISQQAPTGSVPVPGDYDGDGAAEPALWVPQTGEWWRPSHAPVQWGQSGDIPVPADYDGNGTTDLAVWRPSTGQWLVKDQRTIQFGQAGDIPVPEDYNHDGRTDYAVWRPSTGWWFTLDSASLGYDTEQWGQPGDIPAPRDMNGDGIPERMIFRPSQAQWWYHYPWMIPAPTFIPVFGVAGDVPV
jgi:subtilisin family serine protease